MSIFKWPLKTGFTVFATKFVQNSQLGHDLNTTVNGSVILPILQGFFFAKLGICANFRENKTLAKMSEFTVFKPMNMMKACLAKIVRFMAQLEQHNEPTSAGAVGSLSSVAPIVCRGSVFGCAVLSIISCFTIIFSTSLAYSV